jgi:hypothetical protein
VRFKNPVWLVLVTLSACSQDYSNKEFGFYVWHPDVLDDQDESCRQETHKSSHCNAIQSYQQRYSNLEQELQQRSVEYAELIPLYRLEGNTERVKLLQDELEELQELVDIKAKRAHRRL